MIFLLFGAVVSFTGILEACGKYKNFEPSVVTQVTPTGFPMPVHSFSENPFTKEGIELGRKLFYDGRLSIDNMHPCSSCHQQEAAFGTYQHDRSHGVYNSHTIRNAPVLFNLAWNKLFHWDGAFATLENAIHQPITGQIEMGETYWNIIKKIERDQEYEELFLRAFNTRKIGPAHIVKALAQFTGYLTSANSRYDRYKRGEVAFTAQEEAGYQVFSIKCAGCHPEPLFTDYSFRNIGLPVDNFLKDYGVMMLSGKKQDSLKFRVPTLRNSYVSYNYMHDGRFATLQQCINHYRSGIQQSATLDPKLASGIFLTNNEANNILIFLRTLTDSSFITNPAFSKPN